MFLFCNTRESMPVVKAVAYLFRQRAEEDFGYQPKGLTYWLALLPMNLNLNCPRRTRDSIDAARHGAPNSGPLGRIATRDRYTISGHATDDMMIWIWIKPGSMRDAGNKNPRGDLKAHTMRMHRDDGPESAVEDKQDLPTAPQLKTCRFQLECWLHIAAEKAPQVLSIPMVTPLENTLEYSNIDAWNSSTKMAYFEIMIVINHRFLYNILWPYVSWYEIFVCVCRLVIGL